MNRTIEWVINHDKKSIFIILYIGLSLVLSITISLFWLLFAVMVHFAFELVCQYYKYHGFRKVFLESLWETKLDFALVVFAWWLAVYLDFIFGVAGIGAATRMSAQAASSASRAGGQALAATSRVAAWSRIIRGVLLSVDDMGNAAKAIYQSRKARQITNTAEERTASQNPGKESTPTGITINTPKTESRHHTSSWISRWYAIDYIGVILFGVCLLLILLAPALIGMSWSDIRQITLQEFHPLP